MGWGVILLLTFGGALMFEGIGWALVPDAMKQAYREAIEVLDNRQLSTFGLVSLAIGLILVVIGVRLAGI